MSALLTLPPSAAEPPGSLPGLPPPAPPGAPPCGEGFQDALHAELARTALAEGRQQQGRRGQPPGTPAPPPTGAQAAGQAVPAAGQAAGATHGPRDSAAVAGGSSAGGEQAGRSDSVQASAGGQDTSAASTAPAPGSGRAAGQPSALGGREQDADGPAGSPSTVEGAEPHTEGPSGAQAAQRTVSAAEAGTGASAGATVQDGSAAAHPSVQETLATAAAGAQTGVASQEEPQGPNREGPRPGAAGRAAPPSHRASEGQPADGQASPPDPLDAGEQASSANGPALRAGSGAPPPGRSAAPTSTTATAAASAASAAESSAASGAGRVAFRHAGGETVAGRAQSQASVHSSLTPAGAQTAGEGEQDGSPQGSSREPAPGEDSHERGVSPASSDGEGAGAATSGDSPAEGAQPAGLATAPEFERSSSPSGGVPTLGYGVRMQEAIEALHATVELAARQGVAQARITLEPAELGEVRIHLTQTAGGLVARVTAENPAALQALAAGHGQLRQALSSSGLSLARLHLGGSDQAAPGGQQGASGQDGTAHDASPSPGGHSRGSAPASGLAEDSELAPLADDDGAQQPDANPQGVLIDVLA